MSSENLSFNVQPDQDYDFQVSGKSEIPDNVINPAAVPPGIAAQESTIAPSGAEQIEIARDASVPMIPYPILFKFFDQNGISDPATGAGIVTSADVWRLQESKIVLDLLTKWNDNLQEQAAADRRRLSDPKEVRKREEAISTSSVLNAIIDSAAHPENIGKGDIVPLLTVGLIFAGTGGVSDAVIMDTVSTRMVGSNPTVNQAPDAAPYFSDMRAELGLLGAALLQGAAYMANAESIFKAGAAGDLEVTAKAYAEQILGLISSSQLTLIVQNLVANGAEKAGAPNDPELAKNLEAELKAILLSTALAALYTSAKEGGTGWIRGSEFLGLLKGTNETFGPNKEVMDDILAKIKAELGKLPDKGAEMTRILSNYFETNPSLETLTNPAKVFAQLIPYIRRNPDHHSV